MRRQHLCNKSRHVPGLGIPVSPCLNRHIVLSLPQNLGHHLGNLHRMHPPSNPLRLGLYEHVAGISTSGPWGS